MTMYSSLKRPSKKAIKATKRNEKKKPKPIKIKGRKVWYIFELEAMRFMPGEVVEFMYDVNTDTLTEAL